MGFEAKPTAPFISFVSLTMSEKEVHSSIVQCIVIKFLTNEDIKSEDIRHRLRAQLEARMKALFSILHKALLLFETSLKVIVASRQQESVRNWRPVLEVYKSIIRNQLEFRKVGSASA